MHNNNSNNTGQDSVNPALLSQKSAAIYLSISERTLWSLKASHDLPHVRIGRSVRYRRVDLDAYIEKQLHPVSEFQEHGQR